MHEIDAYCIACLGQKSIPDKAPKIGHVYQIKQFRRHDRSIINSQRERTYKLNDTVIAKNRKPRFEQSGMALSDWYEEQVKKYGKAAANQKRSQLTVTKSTRHYNNMERLMPGAVFIYKGQRYVISGQHSKGKYLRTCGDPKTNYPARDCRIIKYNEGLVFIA